MTNFVHLHTHSHFSLLDGLGKIDDLLNRAKELKMDSLALTDHGVMYGAVEFYNKAKDMGIKPIIGCEVYVAPEDHTQKSSKFGVNFYHLTLLATNKEGYKNLIKLTTQAHLKGYYYKPRVDKNLLKKYHKGLIALSGCLKGEVSQKNISDNIEEAKKTALEYQEIFGSENFYLEVMHHPNIPEQKKANQGMIEINKQLGIPLVATNDIHYVKSEDVEAHDILICVQTGKTVDEEERLDMKSGDFSMKSPEEMISVFSDIPSACENTVKIASRCNLELELGKVLLPHFKVPKEYTDISYLKEQCYKGFIEKFGDKRTKELKNKITKEQLGKISKGASDRLEYELSVIEKVGFASYFLIVADFINYAKEQKILVGPGRGSAAGSMISYVLNITEIDPLEYNLLFERFLNPHRITSMPDIDIDFADDRRGEVIDYVSSKYGADHVAQIVTFGTMAAKNSIRDAGRAMGMSYADVDKIAKLIPWNASLNKALSMVAELKDLTDSDPQVEKLIKIARKLEGVARHASTHAAGIVISKDPLTSYVPLQRSTRGETTTTTQFSMYDIEKIGLLKIDLLGLSNLTILQNAIRIIKETHEKKIDLQSIPFDDEKTFQLLQRKETVGVFQLESEGMSRYVKELKPTCFDDLIAIVALYRPGPLGSGMVEDFIKRKQGKAKIEHIHPKLEPVLKETYGVIVYQEQIMQIASELAGYSGSEADILRKVVGKKLPQEMKKQKERFISGCIENEVSQKIAERIFELIEFFAGYGFNKSHATCYAQIAYQTAYLKTHFTECYMAALLTSDCNNIEKIAKEVTECTRLGISVLPPNINESFDYFTVLDDKNIRFGLEAIKNVGHGAIESIVSAREKKGSFSSLDDFIKKIDPTQVNKKVLESLIKSGALDELGKREEMLAGIDQIINYSQVVHKNFKNGQIDMFDGFQDDLLPKLKLPKIEETSEKQRLAWEKELLGLYVSSHPLSSIKKYLGHKAVPVNSLSSDSVGKKIKIGGIITAVQKVFTRTSEPMLFVTVEDLTGNIEVLVFPKLLKETSEIWQEDNIVLIGGKINTRDNQMKLLCNEVVEINQQKAQNFEKNKQHNFEKNLELSSVEKNTNNLNKEKTVFIKFPEKSDIELLKRIQKTLIECQGKDKVVLYIPTNGNKLQKLDIPYKIDYSDELKNELATILKNGKVEVVEA